MTEYVVGVYIAAEGKFEILRFILFFFYTVYQFEVM
jgi:hypothetical protein